MAFYLIHMKKHCYLFISILVFGGQFLFAQSFSLQVSIKNQPDNPVVIGTVSGEEFTPVDTLDFSRATANQQMKTINWQFPENTVQGMYRLIFGLTTYARVMGESPQQLDFVFNREDILFETDFKAPVDSLKIIQSNENQLWFSFLKMQKQFTYRLNILEKEVDHFQLQMNETKNEAGANNRLAELETQMAQKANAFNQLQLERDRFIEGVTLENEFYFVTHLVKLYREPFRDGFLSRQERLEYFQREYFRYVDFSDESLIRSTVLTDKIFDYLVTYNQRGFTFEQREQAYMKAVDRLMGKIEPINSITQFKNPVYEFILDYLVTGFERLKMDKVLTYITENYAEKLPAGSKKNAP